MPNTWNLELIREILLRFTRTVEGSSFIRADGLLSGPPAVPEYDPDEVSRHFYRLAQVACLIPHRINMRPPPDYVAWGASDTGKLWARCAVEDALWDGVLEELRQAVN